MLNSLSPTNKRKKQRGMAVIEMLPILMLFILLVNFALGFFGVIHSGILNSIAARNYAFESFRNRANLNYLRDEAGSERVSYRTSGYRFHSIVGDGSNTGDSWVATQRPIQFTELNPSQGIDPAGSQTDHNSIIRGMAEATPTSDYFPGKKRQDDEVGVDPVWVMTTYGICLDAICGGT